MIHIAEEPLTAALIEEARPLLKANWIVSGSFDPTVELEPDFELYLRCARRDMLLVVTLRDAGVLAGYAVLSVGMSSHHKTLKVAHGEAFYVDPRHKLQSRQLLRLTEELLLKRGVKRIGWFVARGSRAYHFFLRHGFFQDEVVLEKVLHGSDYQADSVLSDHRCGAA